MSLYIYAEKNHENVNGLDKHTIIFFVIKECKVLYKTLPSMTVKYSYIHSFSSVLVNLDLNRRSSVQDN